MPGAPAAEVMPLTSARRASTGAPVDPHVIPVWIGRRAGNVRASRGIDKEETHMGFADKVGNAAEDLAGKAKEAAGKASDNERLEAEGQADQSKADLKKAGENVKDAFKN